MQVLFHFVGRNSVRYVRPHYYDDFKCIGGKCPDTCCSGWEIVIDDKSLDRYIHEKDAVGKELAKKINWQEGCFKQSGKYCIFLDGDRLCRLVKLKGEAYLCDTCHNYPRHTEEFEDVRELSLSISCPIAAKMVLECKEPLELVEEYCDEEDPLEEEFEDFDLLLFTKLEDARQIILMYAKDRNVAVAERMAYILKFAEELQECVDEDEVYRMDDIIEKYRQNFATGSHRTDYLPKSKYSDEQWKEYINCNRTCFETLMKAERMRDEWQDVMEGTYNLLYKDSDAKSRYINISEEFDMVYGPGGEHCGEYEIYRENLLIFFLYTYFCGAVYDNCIYSKAGLAVFSVCMMEEIIKASWVMNDKCDISDCRIELTWRYSREVEHSDNNIIMLEEWFYTAVDKLRGLVDLEIN